MRVLLFTGKGGVGKTTPATGTAVLAGRRGLRTLVLSTDAAHSLDDAFGVAAGAEPAEVESDVWVQQVDAQARFERSWAEVQSYLLSVLDAAGVDPVAAEARRALTTLSLYGYAVDGVLANRVFPAAGGDADGAGDGWRAGWVDAQTEVLADVEACFAPLQVWRAAYVRRDRAGRGGLAGRVRRRPLPRRRPAGLAPGPGAAHRRTSRRARADCAAVRRARRPRPARHGHDLVVTVGAFRRVIALPAALRSATVVGAALDRDRLQVRFSGGRMSNFGTAHDTAAQQ